MSNDFVIAFGYFGLGFGITIAGLLFFAVVQGKKFLNKVKDEAVKIVDAQGKPADESVQKRLLEAAEITKMQNEIASASSMPSSNALHSRHKNMMAARFKQLEEQKIAVLQSIVKEGYDPMVTVFNGATNQNEEVPLSHFLNVATGAPKAQQQAAPPTVVPPESIRKVEKNGKTFFVIDGGKSSTGKKPTEH